ncbi:MAG: DNA primase, partial [Alphaproteobacteria bacterium]|nr:DNA primase [Alphaproteobacteria bacterium]
IVTPDGGHYHCFGCGAHGSHFQYLMLIEHLSFPEAVEKCAHLAGVPLPVSTEHEAQSKFYEELYALNHDAAQFFTQQLYLAKNQKVLDYCLNRGLNKGTMGYFALGYAPNDWHALKNNLLSKGYSQELMLKAGLLIYNEEKKVVYDRFRDRLMFPIFDHQERIIAFGGRALGGQDPKYLNSPETLLFKKGEILYNRSNARRNLKSGNNIVVVEGYMDVITLHQYGFTQAVAPLGTAFTGEHLKALWRFSPEPIFCFDGDEAGQKAHLRAIDVALPHLCAGKSAQFLMLPENEDPDSYLRKFGAPQFQKLLDQPISLFKKLIDYESKTTPSDTPERRALLISKLQDKGKLIQDALVEKCYQDILREQFGMTQFTQKRSFTPPRSNAPQPVDPSMFSKKQEAALLLSLISNPSLLDSLFEPLSNVSFQEKPLEDIRNHLISYVSLGSSLEKSDIVAYLEKTGNSNTLKAIESDASL